MTWPILAGTLIIIAAALAGGGVATLGQRRDGALPVFLIWGEAFAAGVFLGAGLIHMLGDAAGDYTAAGVDYPAPEVIAGGMILLLLWLEHLGSRQHEGPVRGTASIAILATAMLSLHSVLAGAAFGAMADSANGLIVFVAILAHKWAAAFALAVKLRSADMARTTGIICFAVFVLLFPIGVAFGDFASGLEGAHALLAPTLVSLAAGTFLYLGTLHGLSNGTLVARCCNAAEFVLVVAGFALMAVVAIWT